jgi:hypothetical protein
MVKMTEKELTLYKEINDDLDLYLTTISSIDEDPVDFFNNQINFLMIKIVELQNIISEMKEK